MRCNEGLPISPIRHTEFAICDHGANDVCLQAATQKAQKVV
jgi:hypothetical protein